MSSRDAGWALLLSASSLAVEVEQRGARHTLDVLTWVPGRGWETSLPTDHPDRAFFDLYLPVCSATPAHPIVVGHLGQSLDGFIATPSGDSQFVTGEANILHLHRLRALCDAVVVGAGTVAADDPQLTTRLVEGPNALRVVFDPTRRLAADQRLFSDAAASTMYICARSAWDGTERIGNAAVVTYDDALDRAPVAQLLDILRQRGCARVFVEGGGVTVSAFLESDLLDRLHMAIAPLIIGDGRPAIRLAPRANLRDCRRPSYRVFRMGGDVLFDCDLRASEPPSSDDDVVSRVI